MTNWHDLMNAYKIYNFRQQLQIVNKLTYEVRDFFILLNYKNLFG